MALIKCPECGKEISDRAESCPNCAYPIAKVNENNTTAPDTRTSSVQKTKRVSAAAKDYSEVTEEEIRAREEPRRKKREAIRIKKRKARIRKICIISGAAVIVAALAIVLIVKMSDKSKDEYAMPEKQGNIEEAPQPNESVKLDSNQESCVETAVFTYTYVNNYGDDYTINYDSLSVDDDGNCTVEGSIVFTGGEYNGCSLGYVIKLTKQDDAEMPYVVDLESCQFGELIAGAEPVDPGYYSPRNWEEAYYVDEFGDNTTVSYLRGIFEGTFSNSATSGSNLDVILFVDKQISADDYFRIRLIEYGSHIANIDNDDDIVLKVKVNDAVYESESFVVLENDIYFDMDSPAISKLITELEAGREISCIIDITSRFGNGSNYRFKVDANGLADLPHDWNLDGTTI